ncbi:hypothetical protein FYM84_22155 [Pseudomonas sp. CAH-1]|jgi:hypothetical protein|nr:hypothetical protein [Pseudomonas sp. CAH-1]QDR67222.1 hypothetical protein FPB55_05890 [Pseudomonas sp. BJP69]
MPVTSLRMPSARPPEVAKIKIKIKIKINSQIKSWAGFGCVVRNPRKRSCCFCFLLLLLSAR